MAEESLESLRAELEQAKEELTKTKAKLAEREELVRLLFEENPNGVATLDSSFNLKTNTAVARMFGGLMAAPTEMTFAPGGSFGEDVVSNFGMYKADATTLYEFSETPLLRAAMRGETTDAETIFIRSDASPNGIWIEASAKPIEGFGSIAVFRDITEKKRLEDELSARVEERTQLVEQLRAAIDELSVPVLEVWRDVLAAPLVGVLDSQRCARMTERILEEVVRRKARYAIVDLTGIGVIDTATADHIARTMQSIRLLGAEGIVTGLQPQVAQTLVGLDATFQGFRTEPTLRRAIEHCIRASAR